MTVTTVGPVVTGVYANNYNYCRLDPAPGTRQVTGAITYTMTQSPDSAIVVMNGTVAANGFGNYDVTIVYNDLTISTTLPTAANGYAKPQVTVSGTCTIGGRIYTIEFVDSQWFYVP
jgi:hypothetical protein